MKNLEHLLFDLNPTPLWLFKFDNLKSLINLKSEEKLKKINIEKVNKATLDLYEADSKKDLEKNLDKIIPKESYEDLENCLENVFSKKEHFEVETVNYTLKGKRLDLLLRFIPSDKDIPYVVVSTTDIGRFKKLLKTNERLAKLPKANLDIVTILSCKKNIEYINPTGKKLIKSNNLDSILDIFPDDFEKKYCSNCRHNNKFERQYLKDDKNYLMKIHPFYKKRECMITISDITEYTNLKDKNKLLTQAFKRNHQPIIITNSDGDIIKINKAVEDIYGYTSDELIGKNTNVLNPGRDVYKDLGYSKKEYENLFSGLWEDIRDPEVGKWENVVINQTKDGKLKWVELMISTVFDEKGDIKNFIALPVDISQKINETAETKIGLYKALADLAEMRDQETGNHMKRVGLFSKLLAQTYNKPLQFCKDIKNFAPLHDVGKVGISDSILLAERKLTDKEYEKMKEHTLYGYDILKDKKELSMAAQIALSHHENYDGTGYPYQISGKDIPLEAHITSLSDVYDALRSKRPYKEPWSHEKTIKEIYSLSGTKFDPELVEKFKTVEDKFKSIYSKLKG
ncbi:MAG: HD domain-containing phosphohydrolase [Bacillota bacterium]